MTAREGKGGMAYSRRKRIALVTIPTARPVPALTRAFDRQRSVCCCERQGGGGGDGGGGEAGRIESSQRSLVRSSGQRHTS